MAAKSIAAIPAESIPIIGVAVLIADTGYELYAACETMRELDELYLELGLADEATDLENKLQGYQCYYNERRSHSGRNGETPVESVGNKSIDINHFRWQKHCRGLFQLPMAA